MGEPTELKLKDDECAIVMNVNNWGIMFYLPKGEDNDDVPYSVVLLSVIAGMLNKQDPEFMEYMEKVVDKVMYDVEKEEQNEPN